jgi:hypothetical protein
LWVVALANLAGIAQTGKFLGGDDSMFSKSGVVWISIFLIGLLLGAVSLCGSIISDLRRVSGSSRWLIMTGILIWLAIDVSIGPTLFGKWSGVLATLLVVWAVMGPAAVAIWNILILLRPRSEKGLTRR